MVFSFADMALANASMWTNATMWSVSPQLSFSASQKHETPLASFAKVGIAPVPWAWVPVHMLTVAFCPCLLFFLLRTRSPVRNFLPDPLCTSTGFPQFKKRGSRGTKYEL